MAEGGVVANAANKGGPTTFTVKVTPHEARLKRSYRPVGLLNMYLFCKLILQDGQHFETGPDSSGAGGRNPRWTSAGFMAKGVTDKTEINLRIFDKQVIGQPTQIAWATISIPSALWTTGEVLKWFPLSGQLGNGEEGEIFISLSLSESPQVNDNGTIPLDLPSHWDPTPAGKTFLDVIVPHESSEYKAVEAHLHQPVPKIILIQRIQNPRLYRSFIQYLNDVNESDNHRRSPAKSNEKRLWHGTDGSKVGAIKAGNFNRAFAGQHGTKYGNGVYFAEDSNYSVQSFCPPDSNGYRYLYQARVVTGWYTTGREGLLVPPNLPGRNDARYDSVVDKVPQPGIFVVFNDAQAYPEYLITFTCD